MSRLEAPTGRSLHVYSQLQTLDYRVTLEDSPVRTQAHTVTAAAAVRGNRGINPGSQLYKHRFKGHTTTG